MSAVSSFTHQFAILTLDNINVLRYYLNMIRSFGCKETEKIFKRTFSYKLPRNIQKTAMRKLWILNAAEKLEDLRIPPSNYPEMLEGDKKGQQSIRINKQWRLCFKWDEVYSYKVEIVDYH